MNIFAINTKVWNSTVDPNLAAIGSSAVATGRADNHVVKRTNASAEGPRLLKKMEENMGIAEKGVGRLANVHGFKSTYIVLSYMMRVTAIIRDG